MNLALSKSKRAQHNRKMFAKKYERQAMSDRWQFTKVPKTENADRAESREKVIALLNARLVEDEGGPTPYPGTYPSKYKVTDCLCIMVRRVGLWDTRRIPYATPTVIRTYGREVFWFKGTDKHQRLGGELVCVGDPGKGAGWAERMADLLVEGIKAWEAHREAHEWPR